MLAIRDPRGILAEELLPELLIDGSNLTRTAKQLAAMFAEHRRFLFNGHAPVQVVHENDGMPRAVTVTPEAETSLNVLRRFFRTFAFADAEPMHDDGLGVDVVDPGKPVGLDESSFLVSLMTAVCRASLTLAPGILANAPAFSGAGTGKGLATKAICIIASGAPPSAFTSGHDAGEMDKRLTAALVEARPAIFLDNYNSKNLTSDILVL
jgi:hypothetical protein